MPVLRKCSLSGFANFSTHTLLFADPIAIDIFIDILTDRGFCVSHIPVVDSFPSRFDLNTGEIFCDKEVTHRFRITFEKVSVRETARKSEEASHKCARRGREAVCAVRTGAAALALARASRGVGQGGKGGVRVLTHGRGLLSLLSVCEC